MNKLHSLLEKLKSETHLSLEEIPVIDLYMDQVIQLFENKYGETKRNEDDKVLTKTMINNYAKGKLLFPIKNKKYSKEHLLLISLIYQLKGTLTIKDIKETLEGINTKLTEESFDIDSLYNSYIAVSEKHKQNILSEIKQCMEDVKEESNQFEDREYTEKVLLIAALSNISNVYRRAAEMLVDEIVEGKLPEKK